MVENNCHLPLALLLEYNKEDVVNLKALKGILAKEAI